MAAISNTPMMYSICVLFVRCTFGVCKNNWAKSFSATG